MINEDVGDAISEYFQWSLSNSPDDIGYPHMTPFRRLLGSSVRSISLTDEEGEFLDKLMTALRLENPPAHTALVWTYREGKTTRWLEARGKGDRRTIARQVSEGREFIRGAIYGRNSGSTGLSGSTMSG